MYGCGVNNTGPTLSIQSNGSRSTWASMGTGRQLNNVVTLTGLGLVLVNVSSIMYIMYGDYVRYVGSRLTV